MERVPYHFGMDLREAERLERQGHHAEAEMLCRAFVDGHPRDPKGWNLLGSIALRSGRAQQAAELIGRAVELDPRGVRYRINLAAALGTLDRPADALAELNAAVKLKKDVPELWNNVGVTLEKLRRLPEAQRAYARATELRGNYIEAHHNLGGALRKMGWLTEAAAAYRRALQIEPDYLPTLADLSIMLVDLAELEDALACIRRLIAHRPANRAARSSLLYTLHYSPDYDAEALFREHVEWGRLFCHTVKDQIPAHENDRNPDRRLRVGYVSPDLREHTVTKFITAAIEHHDRDAFELFCYSDAETPDKITHKLQGLAEHWHDTRGMKDAVLDQLIRKDQIDILVDLRGHAADNRLTLFARKPAPVQVNMVGYFNTTGLATMDYRITDEHQDPPGMTEKYHTEKLIRLPHSCWCYTPAEDAPEVVEPPALKNGYITFGSLNKIVKVSEPCAKLWAHVLAAVPNSRLLVSAAEADPTCSAACPQGRTSRGNPIRDGLARIGLLADRVDVLGKTATGRQYLQRFERIDVALDTFPFNGITTTCDGLWQGVPCVSLAGGTTVSRAGRSILRAANLPELAAGTPEAFVRAAAELAADLDRLRELRLCMRERLLASPLMDHRGFARHLEAAYRQMWRTWCDRS